MTMNLVASDNQWFKTSNDLIDVLAPLITGNEFKVLMVALRNIIGKKEARDRGNVAPLSLSAFETKTNMSRPTVSKILNALEKFGLLVSVGDPSQKGQLWTVGDNPDIDGLKNRKTGKKTVRKQVGKAPEKQAKVVKKFNRLRVVKKFNHPSKVVKIFNQQVVKKFNQRWLKNFTHIKTKDNIKTNYLTPSGVDGGFEGNKITPELKDYVAEKYLGYDPKTVTKNNWKHVVQILNQMIAVHDANQTPLLTKHIDRFIACYKAANPTLSLPQYKNVEKHYQKFYDEQKRKRQGQIIDEPQGDPTPYRVRHEWEPNLDEAS